jgi:hypothetical protein
MRAFQFPSLGLAEPTPTLAEILLYLPNFAQISAQTWVKFRPNWKKFSQNPGWKLNCAHPTVFKQNSAILAANEVTVLIVLAWVSPEMAQGQKLAKNHLYEPKFSQRT